MLSISNEKTVLSLSLHFFTQSAVCSLHFVPNLYFVPGLHFVLTGLVLLFLFEIKVNEVSRDYFLEL